MGDDPGIALFMEYGHKVSAAMGDYHNIALLKMYYFLVRSCIRLCPSKQPIAMFYLFRNRNLTRFQNRWLMLFLDMPILLKPNYI